MFENITLYLILTAIFLLLYFLATLFAERFIHRKQTTFKGNFLFLGKISRDTLDTAVKGLVVAGIILFLRKLIYYVPLVGIIQTKFSILWVDRIVFIFLILFLVGCVILLAVSVKIKELKDIIAFFVTFLFILVLILSYFFFPSLPADFGKTPNETQVLVLFLLTPLLMLKMLCSGTYIGFLTSFVVGYFIIANHEKFNPKSYRVNKKFLVVLGCFFMIFLVFCAVTFLEKK